jgi:thiol-disulfide isomerase/thioredoxin
MLSKRIIISLFCLSWVLFQAGCRSARPTKVAAKKTIVSGAIKNYDESSFVLTYDQYALLKSTAKKSIEIDSTGQFYYQLDISQPIMGTLNFGRVMVGGTGNNREIFIYLEPGDSLHIQADMDVLSDPDMIKKTLVFSGTGVDNNEFANRVDQVFNSYKQKTQNNSMFIKDLQPDEYKHTVDSIRDTKLKYLKAYADSQNLSPKLQEIYALDFKNLAVIRKFNYPSSNKSFNGGKEMKLPADYYDFVDSVRISNDLDEKGLPYLRYAHFALTNKYKLAKQNGTTEDYLTFLDSELSGRAKYIYMAYSLGSDFNPDIYAQFGNDAPYPDISAIVKKKYSHLEQMLPGRPAPHVVFVNLQDESISSSDFFKGKFVYLDFWATWCKPCVKEIPDLVQLEKEYHDKNIVFASLSVDANTTVWKKFVKEKQLTGIQFWLDAKNKKIYDDGFNITMIPRFVLIDDKGKIIDANAPRPSSGREIRDLLDNSLKKQ